MPRERRKEEGTEEELVAMSTIKWRRYKRGEVVSLERYGYEVVSLKTLRKRGDRYSLGGARGFRW